MQTLNLYCCSLSVILDYKKNPASMDSTRRKIPQEAYVIAADVKRVLMHYLDEG